MRQMPSRQRSLDDLADVQWFADAVLARSNKIARDLGRGKLQPIFDVDERDGDVLWGLWIDGFAQAMELRPEAWAALAASGDADVAMALSSMVALIAVARSKSDLDCMQSKALEDQAPSGNHRSSSAASRRAYAEHRLSGKPANRGTRCEGRSPRPVSLRFGQGKQAILRMKKS